MEYQSLSQLCQKNNQLKNRNNRLLHASMVWKGVILLGSAELGNSKVPNDQINVKGPKFVRGPNLVAWFHLFVGILKDQELLS